MKEGEFKGLESEQIRLKNVFKEVFNESFEDDCEFIKKYLDVNLSCNS
jgi:hypothetical protein